MIKIVPSKSNSIRGIQGNPKEDLKDYAIIDSGCSGSMTGDKDKLSDFKEFKGVCLCARFQVTPKVSHMHAVKRIFRYLKHQPKLGLWYPKDSPFHLEAFSDSDYAGDNHDRRSTSRGCKYLGGRLVSWQCKKQIIVAISSTEAEYIAAASCCAQNPVLHSKTKHIQIRHHFTRDCYEQRLINVVK
ncbi:hypothetical protein Tco_0100584, partial [Tanacetum coccineum]